MAFRVSLRTLEALEWPEVVDALAGRLRTPGARAQCTPTDLFASSEDVLRDRLVETSEARRVLAAAGPPPLGGLAPLDESFARLRKGGALEALELRALAAWLAACAETRRFLVRHAEEAPRLADLAETIDPHTRLSEAIDVAIDPEGEVRDAASSLLREARIRLRRLGGDLQKRLRGYLQDTGVRAALSDDFFTIRNGRYVLPVRSDARGAVRGIVHDASGSGTTLFVEPDGVVELNNRVKGAELEIERETLRVLRELSASARREVTGIEAALATLERVDTIFARAELAESWGAVEPEIGDGGVLRLPQLRHPLLPPESAVPSDLGLGEGYRVLVISGPNAGGKTIALKAAALAVLCARAGLHVAADRGARIDAIEHVVAEIGDAQDLHESLSTFSAHMSHLAEVVDRAGPHSLVVLDEVGVGTDPGEGAALAQAVLEALADAGARVVTTTHYNLLKEMAAVDPRFENASVEFDPETLAPTYRLRVGAPGVSSASAVAARMGLRSDVLARANALLEREDRTLERVLRELGASRMALETEQREARRLRLESEAARREYRTKLERLQERRDKLFASMRGDLDQAFRDAHAEIAGVIRDLQRAGPAAGGDTRAAAQAAAAARERLLALEDEISETRDDPITGAVAAEPLGPAHPLDWRRARPGDPVRILGGGEGVLASLPDKRGRVTVRVGDVRMSLATARVVAPGAQGPEGSRAPAAGGPQGRRQAEAAESERELRARGSESRCDLRGARVAEALERVDGLLDRAASAGRDRITLVHGLGTGALRDAIRAHLAASPYVARFEAGALEEGGDGTTVVDLA